MDVFYFFFLFLFVGHVCVNRLEYIDPICM